jgi:tetratricopeptide (TPR) repeat protein
VNGLAVFVLLFPISAAFGAGEISASECEARARRQYGKAQMEHTNHLNDVKSAWEFARACFDVGEFATDSDERARVAEKGIGVCRELIGRDANLAPAHYYLGMNLGQLARTRGLSALKLVSQMEVEFKRARELDEKFDNAGPDRNLGLLYRDAPRLGSVGSRSKAQRHLEKAAEIAPDFPENRLNLIESYLHWSDRNGARREFKALEELWPRATNSLTGPEWACSWADWKKRLQQVRKKVEEPSKAIESPRAKD